MEVILPSHWFCSWTCVLVAKLNLPVVFFFFAPLWLHLYSNYSDCCKLEWVFKHFSWIILNTLNVPVGFASLKSFSLSRGPVFPPPLGGSVCVGTLRRGGKDLLPCWPCTAPCSHVSPELCPAPISPRGLRAAGDSHTCGEQRLWNLVLCTAMRLKQSIPAHAQVAREFTWTQSTVPSECDKNPESGGGCFEALFLIKYWKSLFSRVVYFLQHFFWSSSRVSMGSSLLTSF